MNQQRAFQVLKVLFPLFLFALAAFEISQFTSNIDVHLLRHEVRQFNVVMLLFVLLLTMGAVSPMIFYDALILRIMKRTTPVMKLIKQSVIANSFSNLLGFGGLIGGMLRTYFFQAYESDRVKLLKTIASVSLFYLTGISLLSWLVLAGYRQSPLLTNTKWLYLAVIAIGMYLPFLLTTFLIRKDKTTNRPFGLNIRFQLIGVSLVEWTSAFLAVWLLASTIDLNLSIGQLFPIFIVASCAGIMSMIPGGLGSFDLVFIWGTQLLGIQDEKVLFLLILYRLGYFLLPFLLAVILFIKEYWDKWNESWNQLPLNIIQRISHILITTLVFLSGLILLLSAALPGIIDRLTIIEELFSLPFLVTVSHQLSVAAGFVLIGLSRGIQYKVKWAYFVTLAVLFSAAIFTFSKGFDYEEAIFIIIVALLLRLSKSRFYRESYVLTWSRILFDGTSLVLITLIYIGIGYVTLPFREAVPTKLAPFIMTSPHNLIDSAWIGLLMALLFFIIGYCVIKPRNWIMLTTRGQENRIYDHLRNYNGTTLTHLCFLHDKYMYWNSKNSVLFFYQKSADKLVILGDPIGEKSDFRNAIEEFQNQSDLYGYSLVFYQVSKEMLSYLHESGFDFFKLGEEAYVDLQLFTLTGKKMKGSRAVKNKFERENYRFEIAKPPFSNELMMKLKEVSDGWLRGRKEKGYSLGFFDDHYLNQSDIALVRDKDNEVVAFTNLMPVYDHNKTISVDLMRFKRPAPSGTMDYVFLSLFTWAKEEGYQKFNLGMAPLSNVGLSKFSFLSEKIASQIFLHGHVFYHFQGLRNFKEKYANEWEGKYLAYRKKSSLPITMAQVSTLISRKREMGSDPSLTPPSIHTQKTRSANH
ncbi:bifunctional lysylphosphatidylglycerol flippase/synthetase MprF [Bacillus sp. NTK071]|uniref:bifunctional lysylphosphatidylglycerol flippase/synthetase MprF n=1 Tax=Bacillus sp. NTK071 TaxID=2802175 RepID=UPI001A8E0901|nr:bifunctional lysylphosphatidylglycerol flippase/synthetase MprF [Bacillus sp. NTK071]MBN8210538.1 bifunctional lysylphosphatidylglycerol flippase/synthetase MprF [Bacillus sp. NTK071]